MNPSYVPPKVDRLIRAVEHGAPAGHARVAAVPMDGEGAALRLRRHAQGADEHGVAGAEQQGEFVGELLTRPHLRLRVLRQPDRLGCLFRAAAGHDLALRHHHDVQGQGEREHFL